MGGVPRGDNCSFAGDTFVVKMNGREDQKTRLPGGAGGGGFAKSSQTGLCDKEP